MKVKKMLAAVMSLTLTIPVLSGSIASVQAAETSEYVMGDVNGDGEFNVADLVVLKQWLFRGGKLENPDAADFCENGVIDVFDYCSMRTALSEKMGTDIYASFFAKNLSKGIQSAEVVSRPAEEEFSLAQTEFALSLLQNESKEDTNTLISPYSVMQALAMTANGADNSTKAEMEKALGGLTIDRLNEYLCYQRLNQPDTEECRLSTANSVWAKESDIEVDRDFLQKTANYYGSDFFAAPFDDSTLKEVNSWVNDKTDKMIPSVLDEINREDIMYLINAVTFDAKWQEPFYEDYVNTDKFTNYCGEVQDVEMMRSEEGTYLEDENAVGFMKYYQGGRYAFAALLPDEGISVNDYLLELTPERLNSIIAERTYQPVEISLPKFSYDYNTELNGTLRNMGMVAPFDPYEADFNKMGRIINPCIENIYIGSVIHKTHIEVAEEGTRAAAVTAVIMKPVSCLPVKPKEVNLDRPFVYMIVDTESDTPVFIGTLVTASAQ